MKICIFTIAGFPNGLAATNRIYYHAKGLIDNGAEVKVIVIRPTEMRGSVKNPDAEGMYNNVTFMYANRTTVRSGNFIKRRMDDLLGPVRALIYAVRTGQDAVILATNSMVQPMFYKYLFKLFGIKFIIERTESMFHNKKNTGIRKIINGIFRRISYKNVDAVFAISKNLQEEYSKVVSRSAPVFHIPVIIDPEEVYRPEIKRGNYIVYTGPLSQKKDGILIILKAFINIAAKHKDLKLIMTGDLERSADKDAINEIIEGSEFKDRMIFKGFVSRDELLDLLNQAAALVLAKPYSEQSDSCFPTKLGEYLSSSNPLVVTGTGEIGHYLKDNVNAFIAEPGSVDSFTEKLEQAVNDRVNAEKVAANGRKAANDNFNYLTISKQIIEIIEKL